MSKTFLYITAAASVVGLAGPASALVIDAFEDYQFTEDTAGDDATSASELDGISVLGGSRDVVSVNGGANVLSGTQSTVDNANSGYFSVSNASTTSGTGTLTYDGDDNDATGVDSYGLGGLDLTDGMVDNVFAFDIIAADLPFDYTLTVWDEDSSDSYMGVIPGGTFGSSEMIAFSSFTGIDFSNVGALQLSFAGTQASDLSIDNFRTAGDTPAVPLPASLPLLLAGLGGVAAVARRKK